MLSLPSSRPVTIILPSGKKWSAVSSIRSPLWIWETMDQFMPSLRLQEDGLSVEVQVGRRVPGDGIEGLRVPEEPAFRLHVDEIGPRASV